MVDWKAPNFLFITLSPEAAFSITPRNKPYQTYKAEVYGNFSDSPEGLKALIHDAAVVPTLPGGGA